MENNYNDFLLLCKKRRSIRDYIDKKISDKNLTEILEAGIQAPSGTNQQGWKFRILNKKKDIIKLSEIIEKVVIEKANEFDDFTLKDNFLKYGKNFYFFKNVPLVILVYSVKPRSMLKHFFKGKISLYKGEGNFLSIGMVLQNMMLAASALDISSCVLTGLLIAEKEINKIFPVFKKYELASALCLGYSNNIPLGPGRKALDKFIVE